MGLGNLKKSWNVLGKYLKGGEFIREGEMRQLLGRARNSINNIERFDRKLRFTVVGILVLAMTFWMCDDALTDFYYWIAPFLCIPALCWDLYPAHYPRRTRIGEMPLVAVVSRINRYHRWAVREWIISMPHLPVIATSLSFRRQVWQYGIAGIISSLTMWTVGLGICLWVYHQNPRHVREIRKNLSELKELNHTTQLKPYFISPL